MKHFDTDELLYVCVKSRLHYIPAVANSAFLNVIIFDMHLCDRNGKMKSYLILKIDVWLFLANNFLSYIDCPRSVKSSFVTLNFCGFKVPPTAGKSLDLKDDFYVLSSFQLTVLPVGYLAFYKYGQ